MTSEGPGIYWSDRVGLNNKIFRMPKFRTMITDTPQLATNVITNPKKYHTPVGLFLRTTSLDELPQIFSIIIGDMSFVGPRPALFNQYDLIELRTKHNIHSLKPGITGLAQISGRDDLSITNKVEYDLEYLTKKSFLLDSKIMFLTIIKVLKRSGVSH